MNEQTTTVPVSDPAHPSHASWLRILLTVLEAGVAIGPAVVAVADPQHAAVAGQIGQIAGAGLGAIEQETAVAS